MFELILHVLIVECILEYCANYKDKLWRLIQINVIAVVSIFSAFNFFYIMNGYAENYKILQINDAKMTEAAMTYKNGEEIENITLYRLPRQGFSQVMPYDEGFDYILYWMKNYYELPGSVSIMYDDFDTAGTT